MFDLRPGTSFGFRYHPRWQFWFRSVGAAQVVAFDAADSVLHLRIFGPDGSVIAHLPIRLAAVQPFVDQMIEVPPLPEGLIAMSEDAVETWREQKEAGIAGSFSLPLGEAIRSIIAAMPRTDAAVVVESAYPVRRDGEFRQVHVVMAHVDRARRGPSTPAG